jgi:hypothetical protein
MSIKKEKFEDTKRVIRRGKLKEHKQYNAQRKRTKDQTMISKLYTGNKRLSYRSSNSGPIRVALST